MEWQGDCGRRIGQSRTRNAKGARRSPFRFLVSTVYSSWKPRAFGRSVIRRGEGGMMSAGVQRKSQTSLARQLAKTWTSYLFILPNVIGVLVFLAYPIVYSLYLSLTKWDFVTPAKFVGLNNYVRLLTDDPLFWTSIKVTVLYVLMYVPAALIASL